jgi:hypothetical protein
MGRASSVEQLPPEVLEQLQSWLRDPRVTQLDAVDKINAVIDEVNAGLGENEEPIHHVSKSALNRYAQRMEKYGQKLRESREVADMWIARLGAQPQGQVGNLTNELIRTLAFEVGQRLHEAKLDADSLPGFIEHLKDLSLTVQRLEKASSENVKREAEIRRQERERILEEAQQAAEAEGGAVTPDQLREIIGDVYGV